MEVTFYFDPMSPYTFLAYVVLRRYHALWDFKLNLKPVYLGGIMKSAKNTPPGLIPSKQGYLLHEMERGKKFFQVEELKPFPPQNFLDKDFNKAALQVSRALAVVCEKFGRGVRPTPAEVDQALTLRGTGAQHWISGGGGGGRLQASPNVAPDKGAKHSEGDDILQLVQNAFHAIHVCERTEDNAVAYDPDRVHWIFTHKIGTESAKNSGAESGLAQFLAEDQHKVTSLALAGKQVLLRNTEEALALGAFGAPWIVVRDDGASRGSSREEIFFGSDRFEQMAACFGKRYMGPNPGVPANSGMRGARESSLPKGGVAESSSWAQRDVGSAAVAAKSKL